MFASTLASLMLVTWGTQAQVQPLDVALNITALGDARITAGNNEPAPTLTWQTASGTPLDIQFVLDIPFINAHPKCSINGNATESITLYWEISDKADYLYPCGEVNGVWVTCNDPPATCDPTVVREGPSP